MQLTCVFILNFALSSHTVAHLTAGFHFPHCQTGHYPSVSWLGMLVTNRDYPLINTRRGTSPPARSSLVLPAFCVAWDDDGTDSVQGRATNCFENHRATSGVPKSYDGQPVGLMLLHNKKFLMNIITDKTQMDENNILVVLSFQQGRLWWTHVAVCATTLVTPVLVGARLTPFDCHPSRKSAKF